MSVCVCVLVKDHHKNPSTFSYSHSHINFIHRMNLGTANNSSNLHYLNSNNHISPNDPQSVNGNMKNVHVQIVKQEQQAQQRYIINRQYIQNPLLIQQPQVIQEQTYWLIVEIESNNEINSYAYVESKDVVGNPSLETLTTGKLVIVNTNSKQRRATVVMASSRLFNY